MFYLIIPYNLEHIHVLKYTHLPIILWKHNVDSYIS